MGDHKGAAGRRPRTLITGGAGFIGSNLAHRLLGEGRRVLLYDNLARPGVEANYEWLRRLHGDRVELRVADTRDEEALREAVAGGRSRLSLRRPGRRHHQPGQSARGPGDQHSRHLQPASKPCARCAARPRSSSPRPTRSTANWPTSGLRECASRYEPVNSELRSRGIGESRPLHFTSPYGCSKGAADQYVVDYARIYGLPAAVFRMSCIYGPHQCGTEDQGWIAHFLIRALSGEPITLYGDGKQVRDVLFVEDLAEAFVRAEAAIDRLAGQAFNIGGGPANTLSLAELMDLIQDLDGRRPELREGGWRPGDQKYYVSDHHPLRPGHRLEGRRRCARGRGAALPLAARDARRRRWPDPIQGGDA